MRFKSEMVKIFHTTFYERHIKMVRTPNLTDRKVHFWFKKKTKVKCLKPLSFLHVIKDKHLCLCILWHEKKQRYFSFMTCKHANTFVFYDVIKEKYLCVLWRNKRQRSLPLSFKASLEKTKVDLLWPKTFIGRCYDFNHIIINRNYLCGNYNKQALMCIFFLVMCAKYYHMLQTTVITAYDTTYNFSLAWLTMSNVVETMDGIENFFLSNPHNVPLLVEILIEL